MSALSPAWSRFRLKWHYIPAAVVLIVVGVGSAAIGWDFGRTQNLLCEVGSDPCNPDPLRLPLQAALFAGFALNVAAAVLFLIWRVIVLR